MMQDVPRLSGIHALSFSEAWSEKAIAAQLQQPATRGLVAVQDSGVGDQILHAFVLWQQAADEAEILTLAVDPQSRRQGIGQTLITRMLQSVGDTSTAWWLDVREGNHAALALYQKLGFRIHSTRKQYYTDGETAVVMLRDKPESCCF